MTNLLTRSMLLMLPLLLSTGAALAQFDDPAPGPDPESTSPLYRGEDLLQTGSYAAAAEIFQQADGLDRNPGVIGASRALAAMGNLQEAMRVCENLIDDDHADFPLVSTQLAEVKRMAGESAEALTILESVVDGLGVQGAPVRTLVQYAGVLQFVGRKPESYALLEEVVDRYNDGLVFSSPDVAMVALASWMLDRFHDLRSTAVIRPPWSAWRRSPATNAPCSAPWRSTRIRRRRWKCLAVSCSAAAARRKPPAISPARST